MGNSLHLILVYQLDWIAHNNQLFAHYFVLPQFYQKNLKLKIITKKQTFSENSKDKLIESLKRRIAELDEENKKLKKTVLYYLEN